MESRRYRDTSGDRFEVRQNTFRRDEQWRAYRVGPLECSTFDIPTAITDSRATQAEAQADLDAYAKKHGLKEA